VHTLSSFSLLPFSLARVVPEVRLVPTGPPVPANTKCTSFNFIHTLVSYAAYAQIPLEKKAVLNLTRSIN
jgi:predicted ATPase